MSLTDTVDAHAVQNGLATETVVVEGACLAGVISLAVGTVTFLDLAPLTVSLKSAGQMQQSMSFIGLTMCIYAAARVYFHFALAACDKVADQVGKISGEGVAGAEQKQENGAGLRAWAWRAACFFGVSAGLAAVYYLMPGGRAAVDSAVRRLMGDLPEILLKASEKDMARVQKRGEKLVGLFAGYFCVLFVAELLLTGLLQALAGVYRKVMGIQPPVAAEEETEGTADAVSTLAEHEAAATPEDSDDESEAEETEAEEEEREPAGGLAGAPVDPE